MIQSPANVAQWDRTGRLEEQYNRFEDLAGCLGRGLECLRGASVQALKDANNAVILEAPEGTFAFGPAVDGTLARQLPDLELASGEHVLQVSNVFFFPNMSRQLRS